MDIFFLKKNYVFNQRKSNSLRFQKCLTSDFLFSFFHFKKKKSKRVCASQISEIEDPVLLLQSTSERHDMWVVPLKVLHSSGLKFDSTIVVDCGLKYNSDLVT